jgi:hypothetical protein
MKIRLLLLLVIILSNIAYAKALIVFDERKLEKILQ